MLRLIAVVLLLTLVGCAQPPPPKKIHAQTTKTDLATRLDVLVNYHVVDDGGIVVVDLYNPRTSVVRLWLVQKSETDGQIITAARRFNMGDSKKLQEAFRVPMAIEGVVETFYVEVFDDKGRLIMKSEPITASPYNTGG